MSLKGTHNEWHKLCFCIFIVLDLISNTIDPRFSFNHLIELAIEVLKDVADEKRGHTGEFLKLLPEPAPDEENFIMKERKAGQWVNINICLAPCRPAGSGDRWVLI